MRSLVTIFALPLLILATLGCTDVPPEAQVETTGSTSEAEPVTA